MTTYSLSHLSDPALLRDLAALLARDRATTASLLAHIGEVDARKLYLPAAHPSMYSYCVHELRLSEDSAYKRIQAARTARQFPAVFELLADGRLHLSALCLLAPHLSSQNAPELLEAATHRSKSEIEQLIAERFPRTELLEMVQAIPAAGRSDHQLAPGQVEALAQGRIGAGATQLAPRQVATGAPRANLTPIASQRFALQVTIGQRTHDKLRYAKALLGHQSPSGDLADVLDRALDALIAQLEKRKFAATDRPRAGRQRSNAGGRYVRADVRRTVWERDGGQCTFASAFMDAKRQAARRAAAVPRAQAEDVTPWLRALGFRADEASRAATLCEAMPDAPLEQRVRLALSSLGRGARALRPRTEGRCAAPAP